MGRGNVCVFGDYEGLYFIDNDYLDVYSRELEDCCYETISKAELDDEDESGWRFDQLATDEELSFVMDYLQERMMIRFRSLSECDKWLKHDRHAFLENALFYIAVADNEWSKAFMLIQKDGDYYDLSGLQKRHYQSYLTALRDTLFELYPEICTYTGPWTSGTIRKEDVA